MLYIFTSYETFSLYDNFYKKRKYIKFIIALIATCRIHSKAKGIVHCNPKYDKPKVSKPKEKNSRSPYLQHLKLTKTTSFVSLTIWLSSGEFD